MPKNDNPYIDPNTTQIPREMHERKKLLDPKDALPLPIFPGDSLGSHRFDILPSNPIHEDEVWVEDDDDIDDDADQKSGKGRRRRRRKSAHANDPSQKRYKASGPCPNCGQGQSSKVTVTGDNYLHMYQEQQKQTREDHLKMLSDPKSKSREKILQENAQKQLQLEQTARAREIQDQMVWWNQQRGLGQYEDGLINQTIEQLKVELGGIPIGYW